MKNSKVNIVNGLIAVFLLYALLWWGGITPASNEERQWIKELRNTEPAEKPGIKAVLKEMDDSIYVPRQHFILLEEAFFKEASSVDKQGFENYASVNC